MIHDSSVQDSINSQDPDLAELNALEMLPLVEADEVDVEDETSLG